MTDEKKSIPKQGDIVWIDFDPSVGKKYRRDIQIQQFLDTNLIERQGLQ